MRWASSTNNCLTRSADADLVRRGRRLRVGVVMASSLKGSGADRNCAPRVPVDRFPGSPFPLPVVFSDTEPCSTRVSNKWDRTSKPSWRSNQPPWWNGSESGTAIAFGEKPDAHRQDRRRALDRTIVPNTSRRSADNRRPVPSERPVRPDGTARAHSFPGGETGTRPSERRSRFRPPPKLPDRPSQLPLPGSVPTTHFRANLLQFQAHPRIIRYPFGD